jgi:hypothetical protein
MDETETKDAKLKRKNCSASGKRRNKTKQRDTTLRFCGFSVQVEAILFPK